MESKLHKTLNSKIRKFNHPTEFVQTCYKQGASRHNMMILELLVRGSTSEHIGKLLLFPPHILHRKYIDLICFLERLETKRFIDTFMDRFRKNK